MPIKFTEPKISTFICRAGKKDKFYFDKDVKGLALRVTNKGSRLFQLRWTDRATHKKKNLLIGEYGGITLKAARDAARIHLGHLAKGNDPIADIQTASLEAEAKQQELKLTLEALIDEWESGHLKQKSEKYKKEATRALRVGFAEFLKRPAIRLSKTDVVTLLDEIKDGNGETMAGNTYRYGSAMYQWAVKRDRLKVNPFKDLPFIATKSQRDRVLTDDELGKIYKAAETIAYPFGYYHRLVALTGQRVSEVAGMCWSELSKDRSTWTIPPARSKNNKGHIVHLSQPVQDILKEIKELPSLNKKTDLIFTTTGKAPISGVSKAKHNLDDKCGVKDWVEHDWRRTMVTGLARGGIDHVVADKLLNHRTGGSMSSIARVYQQNDYLPQRQEALDKWAEHVLACAKKVNLPKNTKQASPFRKSTR